MSTRSRRQPALNNPVLGLVTALLLGLLTSAILAAGGPSDASAAKPRHHGRHARVSIAVLPPVRDPSTTPDRSSDAHAVVAVTVRPRKAVRLVKLQRRTGVTWHTVAVKRSRGGGARFVVGAVPGAVYRAVLPARPGRPAVRSHAAANRWGAPDFVDEFDGAALGPAWEHRIQFYNPWGGRACSKGSPAAVGVSGGVLRLSSMQDPAAQGTCAATDANGRPLGQFPYRLNGHVSTQHSADFLYGVAAARMRFPRSLGQHAAFWLQPRGLLDTGPTPWGAEIDVVEWYGAHHGRQRMASAVHEPMPDGTKRQIGGHIRDPHRFLATRSDTWWGRFHVFSVEWTPTQYVFRIDGHRVWRTSEGVSHVHEFLILSMLSSDFELPYVGGDPTARTAEVDWVAFWQTRSGGQSS
jgi:beta-glucanase (GH16 family)